MIESKGTYIFAHLNEVTKQNIMDYIELAKIPNPVSKNILHCTLVCTDKIIPFQPPIVKYKPPLVGYTIGLDIWETQTGFKCLVLIFNCTKLNSRHEGLMGGIDLQREYISHITLSYDVGDLNISTLPNITNTVEEVVLIGESDPLPIWDERSHQ